MAARRMSRADRETWASARTLAELGELTARWLEGRIASQPGYCGPSDIEDPALVPLLARLCRAGFMTTGSQVAHEGPGYDGAHWEQRAAVEGFADACAACWLARAAQAAGLTVVLHGPAQLPRWRYRHGEAVTVTRRDGRDYTGFGVQLPRRHIRDDWLGYGICHPDAVRALCEAWQVTVIDPEWGRADVLWSVLEKAVSAPVIFMTDEVQELLARPPGPGPVPAAVLACLTGALPGARAGRAGASGRGMGAAKGAGQ